MNPTVEEVANLLKSDAVQLLEDQIASGCGVKISRDRSELFAQFARDAISSSQLSCQELSDEIAQYPDVIRALAIEILNADARSPAEQEDGSIVIERGDLTAGAGVIYAIYFNFLRRSDVPGLVKYLRARRIPSPGRFARELEEIYQEVATAT